MTSLYRFALGSDTRIGVTIILVGFLSTALIAAYDELVRYRRRHRADVEAFEAHLQAVRDEDMGVIRPLAPPGPYTADLYARAQARAIAEEWAAMDEGEGS